MSVPSKSWPRTSMTSNIPKNTVSFPPRFNFGLDSKRFSVTATRTPLQVELKGAPRPLAMTPVVGKGSLGQSTGDVAEEM